jgi:uncharacterized membrane protein
MKKSLPVFFLLIAIACIQIAFYYNRLPAVVVSHFGAGGLPNGWMPKNVFLGVYISLLCGMAALFSVLPIIITKTPDYLINLPNREFWLAPERRAQSLGFIASTMRIFGVATLCFLMITFQFAIMANLEPRARLSLHRFMAALIPYIGFAVVFVAAMFRRFGKKQMQRQTENPKS